tara:strand:- start:27932 stop:28945 length:1014 start_codon:yes stop_codon:yes gene_type:complete
MKTAIKLTFGTMLVAAMAAPAQADFASRIAVNGTLTYTEASNNGLSVGDTSPVFVAGTNTRTAEFIDPDMELDYGLGFTYRMGDNSDTRLFFDWDRYGTTRGSAVPLSHNLGNGVAAGNLYSGSGEVQTDYDQFRFGVTHALHFGDKLDLTLNGFFDYTNIERDLHEFSVNATTALTHYRHTHDEMSGWGPGFGAMARVTPFDVCPQVGLFGGMNGTLLYVDNEFKQYQNTSNNNVNGYVLAPEDSNSMVAKFDAEFGVDYRKLFQTSWAPIMFQAALGLRYDNAVNAFKGGNTQLNATNVLAAGAINTGYAVTTGLPSDFGRFGPFLRFSIGGANS